MEQALLTVEDPVNTGKIWWARLDLNQRPLPCEDSALPLSYAPQQQPESEKTGSQATYYN